MKFTINLVQRQRAEEQRAEERRLRISVFAMVSFGILGIAILFTFFQIVSMGFALSGERNSLSLIKAEYGKYRSTRMIVDKADLGLLEQSAGQQDILDEEACGPGLAPAGELLDHPVQLRSAYLSRRRLRVHFAATEPIGYHQRIPDGAPAGFLL